MHMSFSEKMFRRLLPRIAIRYDILVAMHRQHIEAVEAKMAEEGK